MCTRWKLNSLSVVLSGHAGSVYDGLDQIIMLRTIHQLFGFFKAPHNEKLLIIIWTYINHPHIHALSGVSFTGYMNELRRDSPRLSFTTYIRYQGWAIWAIKQDHLVHKHCELPVFFIAYLHLFSGSDLWATDELARDVSDAYKTTTQQEMERLHYYRSSNDWTNVFGFQSDHR